MFQTSYLSSFAITLFFLPLVSTEFLNATFPRYFKWGVATSAYQIEGAWETDGKGENIWDRFCHEGEWHIEDDHTGDVACDSYNKYQDDIGLMQNLRVDFYRFSLSWSRILPNGTIDNINAAGIQYYNDLIDGLIAADIQPMVTLYHWDLPQQLQDVGGWENDDLVGYFNDYARLCFESFGDRVEYWITFNEPYIVTWPGYGVGIMAPGIKRPATAPYNAAHVILKAHAEAYHTYHDEFFATQQGKISITLNAEWKEPLDATNASSVEAAERSLQFQIGWYAHPVYVNGDYPEVMKVNVAEKSALQGYNESRLPSFTTAESLRIRGTWDFFGLNHYTTQLISHQPRPLWPASYAWDSDKEVTIDRSWPDSGSVWLKMVPWGLRKLLNWVKDTYNNPPVIITENGMSDRNSSMEDDHRVWFYTEYINEVLKAVELDGCDVRAYTAWSLIDNFEWIAGYNEKFGMHYVNFSDPERPRSPKRSAQVYRQIIADNGFPEVYN